MICSLKGYVRTLPIGHQRITLNVGGVGYEVHLPVFVYQEIANLGVAVGDEIEFEIYYHVSERQPRPILVGFQNAFQKAFFERIITVEGIGPLKAINALNISPADAIRAIEAGDTASISQMPGIGQRVAQKVIATLQGKMDFGDLPIGDTSARTTTATVGLNLQNEAIHALIALRYRANEARQLVNEALQTNPDAATNVEGILKEVFRLRQHTSTAERIEG